MDKAPAVLRKPRDAKFVKPDTKDDGLHGVEGNKKDQKLKNLDSLKVQKPAEIQPGKERWHGTVDPAKSKKAAGGDIANAGKLSDPGKTNGHKSSAIVRKQDGKMNPNPSTPKGKAPSKARRQEKPVEGDKASNKKKEGADASKYGKHETDGKGKGKWSENTGAAKDEKPSHKRSSAKAAKVPTLALRPAIHEVLAIDKSGKVVVVSEEQIRVMTKSVTKDMFIGPQDLEAIKSPWKKPHNGSKGKTVQKR
ncbi:hypothetical protein FRC02_007434 [Tulasnella sp. 418]|nr:hypothetical protein FRC02_007434 [Tulasnella sp. 418]